MRTPYRRSKSRVILAALLAASVTVVTLGYRQGTGGPLHKLQDGALSVIAPLQKGMTGILSPVGDFFDSIGHIPTLSSENAKLRKQVAALQAQQARLLPQEQEYQQALGLLHEQSWDTGPTLAARVIGHGPSNLEWTVILDRGSADGVQVGMSVVAEAGLVGRVTAVTGNSSKVLLITDPTSSVGARLTTTGDTGEVTGNGAAAMSFNLLPVTATVATGAEVSTSGYDGGVYPPDIPIGRVSGVHRSNDGLTKVATVQPFVNFNKVSLVLILLSTRPVALPGQ